MAQVYSAPDEIKQPEFNFENINQYRTDCDRYVNELKNWCVQRAERAGVTDQYIGQVIRFPVADGYAEYMVASLKPTIQLIHIPLWDAWEFQYVSRLTQKDIIEKIDNNVKIKKLFGGLEK